MKSLTLILILFSLNLNAQSYTATTDSNYTKLVKAAFEDLKKGDCKPCLEKYEAASKVSKLSILGSLRAALCAFDCKNDDAFKLYLNSALEAEFETVEDILEGDYPEFYKYRETTFYKIANEKIEIENKKNGYDLVLRKELATINKDDQSLRAKLSDKTISQNEKDNLWTKINALDIINLKKVEKIFAKHGYPGKSKIGNKYSGTAWLVIQHSNIETMTKYYKLIEEAALKSELRKSSYALFVDRYRMWRGEKQLYGSQVKNENGGSLYFHPIEDEENVNKRRAEMGLGPIEEYAKQFGIDYKLPIKKE